MSKYEIIKTTEDNPNRCMSNDAKGRCLNLSVEGSEYCPCHGGRKSLKNIYDLKASKYQAAIERHGEHSEVKSLRTEIGILRMLMETRLNMIQDDSDMMLQSQSISNLTAQLEKLVTSCNKIDIQLANIFSEEQGIQWIAEIADIIAEYIEDSEIRALIADKIQSSMVRILET